MYEYVKYDNEYRKLCKFCSLKFLGLILQQRDDQSIEFIHARHLRYSIIELEILFSAHTSCMGNVV